MLSKHYELVTQLHWIASQIDEISLGGELSKAIRGNADHLSDLLKQKPLPKQHEQNTGHFPSL